MPNRQALTDGQLLSIDGTSLYHEATSHVGRRSRSTRAGALGLCHRCADCAPSCSQRGRPGTPSPPTVQCRVRRRSPWPPHHRTAALESARRSWVRKRSDQTHALRAHRTLAHAHRRSDPLVKPARHYLCVGVPADRLDIGQTRPRRRLRGCRLRAAMLGCGFRVRSSTPPSRHLRARSHAAYSAAWAVSM